MFRRQGSRGSARSKSRAFSFSSFFSGYTRCSAERAVSYRHGLGRRLFVEPLEDRRMLATFTVDIAGDDGVGGTSLREAIAAANAAAGADTVDFAPALNGQTIFLNVATGDLDITSEMTIDATALGSGIIIHANDPSAAPGNGIRVFRITDGLAGAVNVELRNLTLTGGDVAAGDLSGDGGAIHNLENLTITNSRILGNRAARDGGGIFHTAGTLTISLTTITDNIAGEDSGGLHVTGAGAILASGITISGNTATTGGGGGASIETSTPATIAFSTISGNRAIGTTAAADGGGLVIVNNTSANILSSTISGNTAGDQGGGVFAAVNAGQTLIIRHSTITRNTSDSDSNGSGSGGGIFFATGAGAVTLEHTIVAGNSDNSTTNAEDIHHPAPGTPTLTANFNLIGVDNGHAIPNGGAPGNQVGTAATPRDPLLAPLANNGGPTQTHALLFNSPAIDTGNPAFLPPPATDQRGFARVVDGDNVPGARIDIGSFEFVVPPAIAQVEITAEGNLLITDLVDDGDPDDASDNIITLRLEGDNLVITSPQTIAAVPPAVQQGPNRVVVARALITGNTIFVNLEGGNDLLTVDSSGGLLDFANGIRFDGEDGFDKLVLHQDAGGATHTSGVTFIGALPGSGRDVVTGTDGRIQRVEFSNIEPIDRNLPEVTWTVRNDVALVGLASLLQDDNQITYLQGKDATWGRLEIDNFEPIEFKNKQNVILHAGSGSDLVNLNNPTNPTALASFTVEAGDPTAGSDTVVVNDVDSATRIDVSAIDADSATVTGAQLVPVIVNDAELLIINGQGGNDTMRVITPAGLQVIYLTDGELADAGRIDLRNDLAIGGAALLSIEFVDLGSSGELEFRDTGNARVDELTFSSRAGSYSDIFNVNAAGNIALQETSAGAVNTQLVTVDSGDAVNGGVALLNLVGGNGDDVFNIAGNHPFTAAAGPAIFIDGGNPSASDVLNLLGAAAVAETVTIAPNAANSTMQDVTGLGGAMLVSGVELIKYTGTPAAGPVDDDNLIVDLGTGVATARVQGAATATDEVISNRLPKVQFTAIADFALRGSTQPTTATFVPDNLTGASGGAGAANAYTFASNNGNDTLVIEGDGGGVATATDAVTVNLNPANGNSLRIVAVNGANTRTIETSGMASSDALNVLLLAGNDSLTVDVSNNAQLITTKIFYDGGTGADTLTVQGAFDSGAGDTTTVTYTPGLQPDEGRLLYTETASEARTMDITFDNMEPVIDTTTSDSLAVNGNGAANSITVIQDPAAAARGLVSVDGFETISFNNKTELVINGLSGNDTVNVNIAAAAVITGLATLRVNANEGDDQVFLESLPTAAAFTTARVDGGGGNDVIDAGRLPLTITKPLTLNGDAGDDTIVGSPGVDTINGGTGNDTMVIRGTIINDILSALQLAPSAGVGGNYEVSVINGPLATPPAGVIDLITTTNAALSPANAANRPTIERILIEALDGDDYIAVRHNDAYSDLNGANGVAAQTITMHVIGDSPNASDRLVVQDNGEGDLVIHREAPDRRSGSIVVGGMAPITYESTERVDIITLNNLGQTGTDQLGRLIVFKDDDFETNESITNATPLGLIPTFFGLRNIDPGGVDLPPFGVIPGDADWYEFRPITTSSFRFEILFEHIGTLANGRPGLPGDGNLRLDVFRADGTLIASSNTSVATPINVDSREFVDVSLNPVLTQSVFIRVQGATAAAINNYDVVATEVDIEGPQVFDPDNGGNLSAIFPNNLTTFNLFDPKPVAFGPTPLITSLTINIRDLPVRFPGDPIPALDLIAASQAGLYSVIGDHVGIVDIASVTVVNEAVINFSFSSTVSAAGNATTFTANALVGAAQQPRVGDNIIFTTGPAAGEVRQITAFNAVTGQITVNAAFPGIPAAGNAFTITSFPEATVTLNFAKPLPDDRFTLRIRDGVVDPSGNRLDGESDASEPGTPTFPSGNGIPGGDFVVRFTVDSRPEIGAFVAQGIQVDINGTYTWDPANGQIGNDATNVDLAFEFAAYLNGNLIAGGLSPSDLMVAGKFTPAGTNVDPSTLFDQLASYGSYNSVFQWLIDMDGDGAVYGGGAGDPDGVNTDVIANQAALANFSSTAVAGAIPVAGNFDRNARNGDEIGLYYAGSWALDTNHDNVIDKVVSGNLLGAPIVGDFDGDGNDDLAVFNNNQFFFDLSFNATAGTTANSDTSIIWGFPGVLDKPVAADMNRDGIDDIGLWVPRTSANPPAAMAEWYFLVSDAPIAAVTAVNAGARTITSPALIGASIANGDLVRINAGNNLGNILGTVQNFNSATGVITLNVGGIVPAVGDVISAGGVANTLSELNHAFSPTPFGQDLYGELGDELAQPIVGNFDPPVALSAPQPVVLEGDFNGDDFVDGDDFLSWQRNIGGSASTNASNLQAWESNFGAAVAASSTGSAAASELIAFASFSSDEVDQPQQTVVPQQVVQSQQAVPSPVAVPSRVSEQRTLAKRDDLSGVLLVSQQASRSGQKAEAPAKVASNNQSRDAALTDWKRRAFENRSELPQLALRGDDAETPLRKTKANSKREQPAKLDDLVFAEF